jgi:hypothetical protein
MMLYSMLLQQGERGEGASLLSSLCSFALAILVLIAMWRIYEKARKPGWAAIIPIYNIWVLLEIVGKEGWWIILFFIPFVNIIALIVVLWELAKSFGKDAGFAIGLILLYPIFMLILAFSDAEYVGPGGTPAAM